MQTPGGLLWFSSLLKTTTGSQGWMIPGHTTEMEIFWVGFASSVPLELQRHNGESLVGLDAELMPHPVPDQSWVTSCLQSWLCHGINGEKMQNPSQEKC